MKMLRVLPLFIFSILFFTACVEDEEPFSLSSIPYQKLIFYSNQSASYVIGQNDFTSNLPATSQNRLNSPQGLDFDSGGALRITEHGNNRILGYNSIPLSAGVSADFVVGQENFNGGSPNRGDTSPSAKSLNKPMSGRSGEGKFIVADASNHRVLIFNSLPGNPNASADVVVGAASFTVPGSAGCNTTDLNSPSYALSVGGKLLVADTGNHRVLIYNSTPSNNLATPSLVIGQPDFTTCATTGAGAATSSKLHGPSSIWSDGNKLIIADQLNHRVLIWNTFPVASGQAADVVLGQANFNANASNSGGTSAISMSSPVSVNANPVGQLFLSDQGNNRILIWDAIPTTNQQPADHVLGQGSMTSDSAPNPPKGASLSGPGEVLFTTNSLMVADSLNHRVLIYNSR